MTTDDDHARDVRLRAQFLLFEQLLPFLPDPYDAVCDEEVSDSAPTDAAVVVDDFVAAEEGSSVVPAFLCFPWKPLHGEVAYGAAGGQTARRTFPVGDGKIAFSIRWTVSRVELTWSAEDVPRQRRVFITFVDAASERALTSRLDAGRISAGRWGRSWESLGLLGPQTIEQRRPPVGWGLLIELSDS